MSEAPTFERDLAELPTHAFGNRSLTWWGVIGYMVIEAVAFGLAIAAYFFLMAQEPHWPPEPWLPPDLIWGTLFTIVILLSEIPNTMAKRAAERYDLDAINRLLPIIALFGLVLLVLRGLEFTTLNVRWTENAYGSIIWCLLFLHTLHIGTDWFDTLVLAALMRTPAGDEGRRYTDVSENSLYWRYVWLTWIPIYLLIYWLPRWL
jgi:heme/copper-type cytochrome/quinol oxidase subunit 3